MESPGMEAAPLANRRSWLTPGRAIGIVALAAAAARFLSLCSTPLIVTWDGGEYIIAALELLENGRQVLTPYRTPGYPILLAGGFAVLGSTGLAVVALQHSLGVAMCILTAWAACRLAGPVWGLVLGLAMSLEPILLAMEAHALSESPSTVFAVACTAIALADRRALPRTGLLLGVMLGIACLIRPALQVLVPFYAIGWAVRGRRPGRVLLLLVLVGAGFLATITPWVAYNRSRDVPGLARGSTIAIWYGLARCRLITPPPEYAGAAVAAAFHEHLRADEFNSEQAVWRFYNQVDAVRNPEVYRLLSRWSVESVRAHPLGYAAAAGVGILWQLDAFVGPFPFESNQNWFMTRFRQDGRTWGQNAANFNMGGDTKRLEAFAMPPGGGVLHAFYAWYVRVRPAGWPQIPLAILSLAGVVVGVLRRNWTLALVSLGTIAFICIHGMLLLAQPRYGMPAWATWYIVTAAVIGAIRIRRSPVGGN